MTIEIKDGDSPIKQQEEDIDVTQLKEESQEELWRLALHHAGSRMDFLSFLTKHFTITRKP